MIDNFNSRQFILFLFTGGVAAAINFFSRIIYSFWFDFSVAVLISYLTGMVAAFFLFRAFVFKGSSEAFHRSAFFFVLVNILAAVQTWAVSIFMAYYVLPVLGVERFAHEIAHGIGIAVPAFTSYFGHKHWSFKE